MRLLRAAALAAVLSAVLALPVPASAGLGTASDRATGLNLPWNVLALPDGRKLITERGDPAQVRVLGADNILRADPAYSDATAYKFLGMALSPGFDPPTNPYVYLYVTDWTSGPGRDNQDASRVIRLAWDGTHLISPTTIFDAGIWSDGNHDGGRIAFGPDGKLYVTTGDVHDRDLPQDLERLNGKILRLNEDGTAPADNPFFAIGGNARYVWSYGHRHPQGIAWDSTGRMWETEHGPSGGAGPYTSVNENTKVGRDEINRIEPGCDYGWPVVTGEQTAPGMSPPVVYSGTTQSTTWAPGGLAIGADGRLYVPALVGKSLRSYPISNDALGDPEVLFKNTYGRIRTAVTIDSSLWLTTSNSTNSPIDKVIEVPFSPAVGPLLPPPVRAASACPESPPASAAGNGAQSSSGGAAAVAGPAIPAVPPLSRSAIARELRALLAGQARTIARQRAASIARLRRIRLRTPAMPAKRMALTLTIVDGRRRTAFAGRSITTGTGRPGVAVLISTDAGRRTLARLARSHARVTLVLTARLRRADGSLVSESRRFTTRRAG